MNSTAHDFQPTPVTERYLQLDVLRGFALLGVLLVNVDSFSGAEWAIEARLPYPWGWGGETMAFLRHALLETKAAALLAMLFGAGLAIQHETTAKKGSHVAFALRRAAMLALLGLAHTFLLWNGDILLDYAVISLMVLPFLGLGPTRILWAIPILLVVSGLAAAASLQLAPGAPTPAWLYAAGQRHYGLASWWEAFLYRSWETVYVMSPMRIANRLPILTPFFILGVFFWKRGVLANPGRHTRSLCLLLVACLGLGLLANLIPREVVHPWVNREISVRPLRVLIKAIHFLAQPGTTLGYFAGILLLVHWSLGRRLLAPLAPLGRTALSQYLLQSLACTLIFNGYGLGLYGQVPMNVCLLGGVVFFAFQVWSSRVWLAHFRMGPAEWLWRRVTYAAPQAFRLEAHARAGTARPSAARAPVARPQQSDTVGP
jgi:uncharacterized protein